MSPTLPELLAVALFTAGSILVGAAGVTAMRVEERLTKKHGYERRATIIGITGTVLTLLAVLTLIATGLYVGGVR